MLHMNKSNRYKGIHRELMSIYELRGLPVAHYFAGMLAGYQIALGLTETERENLRTLTEAALRAK